LNALPRPGEIEGIPKDMPILIDEAYHHFVDDPAYGTSMPYVLEGRPVIVARTFSKIAALAAMRIGYAVSTPEIIRKMRPFSMGSVNEMDRFTKAFKEIFPKKAPQTMVRG